MTKLPYDAEKDFAPVLPLISFPLVLVVSPNLQVKTVAELIVMQKRIRASYHFQRTAWDRLLISPLNF
jgi:tripartite-type tricarboxylate transporter receptor subunit TctC